MKIRMATSSDVEGCMKVNEAVWKDMWKDKDYLKERVRKAELVVALDGKNILGYAAFRRKYWKDNFFIEEMAVYPKHQRSGVGSAIIREIGKICAKEKVRLFSTTDSKNKASIEFHEKNGFSRAGHVNNMFLENRKEIVFSKKPK